MLRIRLATILLLTLVLIPRLAAAVATVQPLVGRAVTGAVLAITADQVVLDGQRFPLDEVDWIETGASAPDRAVLAARLGLWLVDGGWLPASGLAGGSRPDSVQATTPLGTIDLPLASLLGWGPGELPAPAPAGDRVQVAAGPLDGRVQGIAGGQLRFASSLDPQPLALAVPDVLSLRLAAGPAGITQALVLTVRLDDDRPPLRLVPAADGHPTLAGTPIDLAPLAGLRLRMEGAGSHRTYLSDLDPVRVEETGAFGTVWPWRRDQDLDGGPLRLAGQRAAKGICVHSAATITWRLDGAYVRFSALAGIADLVRPEGDCLASLSLDGASVWSHRLRGDQPPVAIDLPVSGGRELTLRIDLGERYDIGDHVALADAWLVRAP